MKIDPEKIQPIILIKNMLAELDLLQGELVHPGTMDVFMKLKEANLPNLAVLACWYTIKKDDPEWKSFFVAEGSAWLWTLYHTKNHDDLPTLIEFLSFDVAQQQGSS